MKAIIAPIALALAGLAAVFCPGAYGQGKLLTELKALNPDLQVESVSPAPVDGLSVVELSSGSFLYATQDGRHFLAGDLYEIGDAGIVNLTERRRSTKRRELMAKVDPNDLIVFSPDGPPKAVVSVFTDVDCVYCRKLHLEMAEINALGVEVRYFAFPRAGVGSRSYEKTVSAWCADNPNRAITQLKLGNSIPDKSCPNPVAEQYALGQSVGVTGTPALITETGAILPGYMPAADLAVALGL